MNADHVLSEFMADHRELIFKTVNVLEKFRKTDLGQDALKAYSAHANEESVSVQEMIELTTNIMENNSELGELRDTAHKNGVKAFGLDIDFTASLLTVAGIYAGAGVFFGFDSSAGTRSWKTNTKGLILEVDAGFGITYFNKYPAETAKNGFRGLMFTFAGKIGFRLELFWFLDKPDEPSNFSLTDEPSNFSLKRAKLKGHLISRAGFRVSLRGGYGLDGVIFKGQMKSTKLKYPSFTIKPMNLTSGEPSNIEVTIGHASLNKSPNWLFQNNENAQTSCTVSLPDWLSDSVQSQVSLVVLDWGLTLDGSTLQFLWNGADNTVWDSDFVFTIENAVNNASSTPPQDGLAKLGMRYMQSKTTPLKMGVVRSSKMSLQKYILSASMTWTLDVDGQSAKIPNDANNTITGTYSITTSEDPDIANVFYYIKDSGGLNVSMSAQMKAGDDYATWDMGYELINSGVTYKILPVMWQDGTRYTVSKNTFKGDEYQTITTNELTTKVSFNHNSSIALLTLKVTLDDETDVGSFDSDGNRGCCNLL